MTKIKIHPKRVSIKIRPNSPLGGIKIPAGFSRFAYRREKTGQPRLCGIRRQRQHKKIPLWRRVLP
jgi:hypothetical protein